MSATCMNSRNAREWGKRMHESRANAWIMTRISRMQTRALNICLRHNTASMRVRAVAHIARRRRVAAD
eukprot:2259743-Pleurochrysis_carterae.AAC.2